MNCHLLSMCAADAPEWFIPSFRSRPNWAMRGLMSSIAQSHLPSFRSLRTGAKALASFPAEDLDRHRYQQILQHYII